MSSYPWIFEAPPIAASSAARGQTDRETVSRFPRYSNAVRSLPPQERAKINAIAQAIVRSYGSGQQPIRTVQLIGHADQDTPRRPDFEKKISGDRALEVQKALVKAINNPRISSRIQWQRHPVGASQLIVKNPTTEQDRLRNRRVEVILVAGAKPSQPHRKRRYIRMRHRRIVGEAASARPIAARFTRAAFGPIVKQIQMPIANSREDVLNTMDRLHLLWSINNSDYNAEYPVVAALALGASVDVRRIPLTVNAIVRNQDPTLHHQVAQYFLNQPLTQPVGLNQLNLKSDVFLVQNSLRALGLLNDADYATERTAIAPLTHVTSASVTMPRTLAAITGLKDAIAGGRLGWAPLQADESEAGGDRFGGRTFDFTVTTRCFEPRNGREQDLPHRVSVFVPRGVQPDVSNVHIYFSPRGASGNRGDNDVLVQGLRGAADSTNWVVIGVSGITNGWRTIDNAAIETCLRRAGLSPNVAAIRLSGHSRGVSGLAMTLSKRSVTARIDRTVILDAPELFSKGGTNVIVYRVNVRKNVQGAVHRDLDPACARAIGYTRLIRNAMVTQPLLTIPSVIRSQLLPIPNRGCFRTAPASTLSGCQVNITDFCRTNRAAIAAIIQQETRPDGLHTFIEHNDLLRAGHPVLPTIYSHHVFVAEIAHEIML